MIITINNNSNNNKQLDNNSLEGWNKIFDMYCRRASLENQLCEISLTKLDSALFRISEKAEKTELYNK